MNAVEQIAATVLYEGYLLWPYGRSAGKNQKRWTLGGVYPRAFSQAHGDNDPWLMQTQCLVVGENPIVSARLRFLHVVKRQIGRRCPDGSLDFVDSLQVGPDRYLAWDEATEREIRVEGLKLAELAAPRRQLLDIEDGSLEELLTTPDGRDAGAIVRSWRSLHGEIALSARTLQPAPSTTPGSRSYRLTVTIANTTPWYGQAREETLRQTFVSAHTILTVTDGEFVSLMDPPPEMKAAAEACQNVKTWPVLAGEAGDKQTMLSSPIILYDYPQIAPESPGDLFDGTEIDQLLVLNILTLTDEEKAEMRDSDPRGREILERTEALTTDDFMRLHGAIREFRQLGPEGEFLPDSMPFFEELERPRPTSVTINGQTITRGSRVRLRPRPGGDIFDLALAGKIALIEGIEQDYEERIHLAVVIEDDPGREFGLDRQPGHRFFFAVDEIEPLPDESM